MKDESRDACAWLVLACYNMDAPVWAVHTQALAKRLAPGQEVLVVLVE